jgi:hypothetical protein
MYNNSKRCHAHTEGTAVIERVPVTNCTSYKAREDHSGGMEAKFEDDSYEILPAPGTENYDNMAFDKEVVGIVDADGKLQRYDEPLTLDEQKELED